MRFYYSGEPQDPANIIAIQHKLKVIDEVAERTHPDETLVNLVHATLRIPFNDPQYYFALDHKTFIGEDHCGQCRQSMTRGCCKITRHKKYDFVDQHQRVGKEVTSQKAQREFSTLFPYQGFHILGSHRAFEGECTTGKIILEPERIRDFFIDELTELREKAGEPGGAFYRVFHIDYEDNQG
jgi:hypothetical protein